MLTSNRYHVTYCTNIHPGKDWKITFENIKKYVPEVKKAISPKTSFGLGLRLSNQASLELGFEHELSNFKNWLDDNDVYVFTINGFPYGSFHGQAVKDKVHKPDWTTSQRHEYTSRIFRQLAYLVPDGVSGGISTSPVGYKHWYKSPMEMTNALQIGAKNMVKIAVELYELEKQTGQYLHLDIEPEPDGLLENSHEVIDFFKTYLVPVGREIFHKKYGLEKFQAEEQIKRYLTICYDICHFSLAFEEPEYTFQKFSASHIKIGKIQVSAALKIISDLKNQEFIWQSLAGFNESTYLHQVTEKIGQNVITYPDLPIVLAQKKSFNELRAHFHVPIFLERFDNLYSTQDHILKVLDYLKSTSVSEHLEVETYTWEVLPRKLKQGLVDSIVREMQWLLDRV